jgi:outer membrane scaffolding protein for murein synthesis (MipA/OmpV family)
LLAITAFASIGAAHARDEPLWEAGIGIAGLHFPDYRGSDQSGNYALPVPYLVYRGDFLKADRDGVRGRFLASDSVALNLSVGASLPVKSGENEARRGMADLRPSLEAGPSLEFSLWRTADRRIELELRTPLRAAVTIESHPEYVGLQFYPHVNLDVHDPGGLRGWNLGLLAGPVFTDQRYNRHYYAVSAADATPTRPVYDPRGGYGGFEFIVALSKRFPKYWVGGFLRYDTLRGAVYEDSPLVRSRRYFASGFGISWVLGESSERVPVNDYGDALR